MYAVLAKESLTKSVQTPSQQWWQRLSQFSCTQTHFLLNLE